VRQYALIVFFCLFTASALCADNARYYQGSGGSGLVIAIPNPSGSGLAEGDEWILDFIRIIFTNNFNKFTAVSVQNQEGSGTSGATLLLSGKLTRAQQRYQLEFSLSDVQGGIRRASYLKTNLRSGEILSLTALNAAFEDIIGQIEITLTEAGKKELGNPPPDEASAAVNIARGTTAKNPIEELNYLYNAMSYDPSLIDAASRFNSLSSELAAGNPQLSIRSDLEARSYWKDILGDFETFYTEHPPFEISYVPTPNQLGKTDYDQGTAVLQFRLCFQENVELESMQRILSAIKQGLHQTGKRREWGFSSWPYRTAFRNVRRYTFTVELVNNRDEVLDTKELEVSSRLYFSRDTVYADSTGRIDVSFKPLSIDDEMTEDMIVRVTEIDGIETEQAQQGGYVKITPVAELPKLKTRGIRVLLTRDFFNIR
jgi:hypothetical protein